MEETSEEIILRWDSEDASSSIFSSSVDRSEINKYLSAVDDLILHRPSSALQIAMARLEDEFRSILLSHSLSRATTSDSFSFSFLDDDTFSSSSYDDGLGIERGRSSLSRLSLSSSSGSLSISLDLLPSEESVSDLRMIADRMVAGGYARECVQAYASVRKAGLESAFRSLGIGEKLTIGEIQRLDWESLESRIRRWIPPSRTCLRTLFPSEKSLCSQLFDDDEAESLCFSDTVKGPATHLLNFPEAVSIGRRSPEKLFKILDLHDTLLDLLPDFSSVFDSRPSEGIRVQASEIVSRLAEAARGILSEFENKVLREPSTVPVPGGTVHPLTRYVMNYINLISDYKATLSGLISSVPSSTSTSPGGPSLLDTEEEVEGKAPLSVHLVWIIVILQFNLEGKSKHYKDAALAHLFTMNNVHYIVMKVKGSPELRELIGDDYLKKLTGRYRQAATAYQRSTWVRVLYCLRDEGLHVSGAFSSGVSRNALRERFKAFNATLDEVHRVQAGWIVPDSQLREELRIAISELLVPAYRSFLGRFRSHIESGRHPEAYIKYSVEDLEDLALDFFDDCQAHPQHSRRRSQS